jgi:PAS domain S-box-containing protein
MPRSNDSRSLDSLPPQLDAMNFAALVENSCDFIGMANFGGEMHYINPLGRKLIEFDEAKHPKLSLFDFLPEEDVATFRDETLPSVMLEGKWTGERTIQCLGSTKKIPVDQTIFLVKDPENGTPLYFGTIIRDLSESKRLLANLHVLEKAVDSTNEGVIITDSSLKDEPIIYVNRAFSRITGYTKEEAIGKNCRFLSGNEEQPGISKLRESLREEHPCRVLLHNRRKDGTRFWNELSLAPVKNEIGKRTHFIGIQHDVTTEIQAKEELEQKSQRLKLALSAVEMGTWEYDIPTGTIQWDEQMYNIFRIQVQDGESIREAWTRRVDPSDLSRVRQDFHDCLAGFTPLDLLFNIRDDDGNVRSIRQIGRHIFDEKGNPNQVIGIAWDMTREIEALEIIEQQRLKIHASARLASLGEMAGGIAHEINNPLAIILAYADMSYDKLSSGSTDWQDFIHALGRIKSTAQRIAQIVRGLKAIARDGADDAFEETPLHSIIQDALSVFSEKARNQGIEIQVSGMLDTKVECRSVQLTQVLSNLMANALHAAEKTEKSWVKIHVDSDHSEVRIRVFDSGFGVPVNVRDKIFQPFFTTKKVGEGTGLGLSISRSIIQDHGGDLSLDTLELHTCFVVRIPLHQEHEVHQEHEAKKAA